MDTIETKLSVTGMTCGSCVKHVRGALLALDGVDAAEVDLDAKLARIRHDPATTTAAELVRSVVAAGYGATTTVG